MLFTDMQIVQIGGCQIWEENHENGSETCPYGSVRADIHTGWIPQALGSLWDASRALKPSGKSKNRGFPCFSICSSIFLHFPIIPQQQHACCSFQLKGKLVLGVYPAPHGVQVRGMRVDRLGDRTGLAKQDLNN